MSETDFDYNYSSGENRTILALVITIYSESNTTEKG